MKGIGLDGIPEIDSNVDLSAELTNSIHQADVRTDEIDVICVAQKIVSKFLGLGISLSSVSLTPRAHRFAEKSGKRPEMVQLILDHSDRVIRVEDGVIISETPHGFVCANAGLDQSNIPSDDTVMPLPEDPDREADKLRTDILPEASKSPSIIMTDTWGRPWREGQVNVAIGVSGVQAIRDYRGRTDSHGTELTESRTAVADELAAASEIIMGKSRGVPAVAFTGTSLGQGAGTGKELLRAREHDLFR